MKDTQLPRPFDERFIAEQLEQMVAKNYPIREIAGWFARWGYEEGKADLLMALISVGPRRGSLTTPADILGIAHSEDECNAF